MKDFLGRELKVGDEVVCIEKGYNNLLRGEIVKITPKTLQVKYTRKSFMGIDKVEEVKRFSDQVVKI